MRECNIGDGEEETELGGASFHLFHLITGYPGDLKFPGRCDRHLFQFSSNWRPRCGTWSGSCLTFLFVTRMEVPHLTVPSTSSSPPIIGTKKGEQVSRPQVIKKLWAYLKEKNRILKTSSSSLLTRLWREYLDKRQKCFGMSKHLKEHLINPNK